MSTNHRHTIPVYDAAYGSWAISIRRRAFDPVELASRYDRIACRWHRLCRGLGLPHAYKTLFAQLPQNTSGRNIRVLDCGTGTGEFGLAFVRARESSTELHGVDVSQAMLSEAEQRLRAAGVCATLQRADLRRLPYPSQYFDVVAAAHVLEHLPDPRAALDEMRRVLKPGGHMVICLTRRSLFGTYIQLKWRTHQLTAKTVREWLHTVAMDAKELHCGSKSWLRMTSLAFLGTKQARTAER